MPTTELDRLTVRQIAQFASKQLASPSDLTLLQSMLGAPFEMTSVYGLVEGALEAGGPFGVGHVPPADANGGVLFTTGIVIPVPGCYAWNAYQDPNGVWRRWMSEDPGRLCYDGTGWSLLTAPSGGLGTPIDWTEVLAVTTAGDLSFIGNLGVGGFAEISGNAAVGGSLGVDGNLTVLGATQLADARLNNLTVLGTSLLMGPSSTQMPPYWDSSSRIPTTQWVLDTIRMVVEEWEPPGLVATEWDIGATTWDDPNNPTVWDEP